MRRFAIMLLLCTFAVQSSVAQKSGGQDVFVPICKYMQTGEYSNLSAWFADNMELDLLGSVSNCSRNQARLIMKNFFDTYTPRRFNIIHKGSSSPTKYAVGSLEAGGEKFRIILLVKPVNNKDYIQQLKIEKE